MHYFDIKKMTELVVDASPVGLGAILTQKTSDDEICAIAFAGRRLSDTETCTVRHRERHLL